MARKPGFPGPGAVMPQGPSRNPFEKWLKGIALGPGFSSGGVVADVQRINFIPGFQFNASGLGVSGEEIGTGSWAHNVVFDPTTATATIGCIFPSTINVHLPLKLAGLLTTLMTIDFTAGSKVGAITVPAAYTLAAGTPITLYQASPADVTLASIFGTVYLSMEPGT